jgi:hypothetical protein
VFFAGFGHRLRAVAFGHHDEAAAVGFGRIDEAVHSPGGGGAEGTGGHAFGGFRGAGVVDGMVLEKLRHRFAAVQHLLDAGVGGISCDD